MNLATVWNWLTTSKYTRLLERENEELRAQLKEAKRQNELLTFALGHRQPADPLEAAAMAEEQAAEVSRTQVSEMPGRQRMRKRVGFSQVKRQLESQAPPSKGA